VSGKFRQCLVNAASVRPAAIVKKYEQQRSDRGLPALQAALRALARHRVDAVSGGAWGLAKELDPRSLHARVVLRRFGQ
jgi:hypothetical protein